MNVKVQINGSPELTPKSHHGFILQHFQTVILSLSKDGIWI
jgi:hypothetical protein